MVTEELSIETIEKIEKLGFTLTNEYAGYYVFKYKNTSFEMTLKEKGNYKFSCHMYQDEKELELLGDRQGKVFYEPGIFKNANIFKDYIERPKSLDELLDEGKSFKEINKKFKDNNIER